VNIAYQKEFIRNPLRVTMKNGAIINLTKQNVQDILSMKNHAVAPPCPSFYTCENQKCKNQIVFSLLK
jgi:hypothetical protein